MKLNNPILGSFYTSRNAVEGGGIQVLNSTLGAVITISFVVALLVFFFMLLIGGIQWLIGDKNSVEAARHRITNSFIGLVVTLSIYAIILVVETFFGIDILLIDTTGILIR